MKPALTPEEWVGYHQHGDALCRGETQITAGIRGSDTPVIGVASEQFEYGAILPESCHAVAALCLHDQPFGPKRKYVRMLQESLDDPNARPYVNQDDTEELIDFLAALLPPEKT